MSKDLVLYHVYGRLENETLDRENVSREEIADIVRFYMGKENKYYSMIIGINNDGVICSTDKSPLENIDPLANLEVVSWTIIQDYRNQMSK